MSFENFNYTPTIILTIEEYRSLYDVPDSSNIVDQNNLISKWLLSAQDQLNSISNGQLYGGIDKLDSNSPSDQQEFYMVKRCIGDWVEYFIQTSRIFMDRTQNVQSAVPLDLSTHSSDGDIENKRLDILRKFALTRFYKTRASQSASNLNEYKITSDNVVLDFKQDWFAELINELGAFFKRVDNVNEMVGDLTFKNSVELTEPNSIYNVGNIFSYSSTLPQKFWPVIKGFQIDAALVGTVAQSEVALGANKVYWEETDKYLDIKDIPNLAYFGTQFTGYGSAVNRQELYGLLEATVLPWRNDFVYNKDVIVRYIFLDSQGAYHQATYQSLLPANLNNDPRTSPTYWRFIAAAAEVDYNLIIQEATIGTIANFDPLWTAYKLNIDNQWSAYKLNIDNQLTTFETTIDNEFVVIKNAIDTEFNTFENVVNTNITNRFTTIENEIPTIIDTALDALPTINVENIIFKKDTWYQFVHSQAFSLVIEKYGLVSGVHYLVQEDYFDLSTYGSFSLMGHAHVLGPGKLVRGSDLIYQSNLPNTKLYLRNEYRSSDDGQILFHRGQGGNSTGLFPLTDGFWNANPTRCDNKYFIQMNRFVQENFMPRQGVWYNVLFLKDIIETQKGVIRNVAPPSWGNIVGDIQTQTDLVTNFTQKPYVDNLTDTLRTDLGDLGNIVNANTQQIALNKADIVANRAYINSRFLPKKFWIGQQFNFNNATNRDLFYTSNAFTTTQASKTGNNVTILQNIEW